MRIAICDDEPNQLEFLSDCVRRFSETKGLSLQISLFLSAEKFWFSWKKDSFSVILLDIQMQGQSGMELARQLRQKGDSSAIIFITGLPDYIGEGYDVSAVHYLIKPIDEKKLFSALEKAISSAQKQPKKLIFTSGGENIVLSAQEIEYAEAFSHTALLSLGDSSFEITQSFGSVLPVLEQEGFVRCHRSYAVNISHIHSIKKYEIILDSKKTVPVSRRLYDKVNRAFISFYKGGAK